MKIKYQHFLELKIEKSVVFYGVLRTGETFSLYSTPALVPGLPRESTGGDGRNQLYRGLAFAAAAFAKVGVGYQTRLICRQAELPTAASGNRWRRTADEMGCLPISRFQSIRSELSMQGGMMPSSSRETPSLIHTPVFVHADEDASGCGQPDNNVAAHHCRVRPGPRSCQTGSKPGIDGAF